MNPIVFCSNNDMIGDILDRFTIARKEIMRSTGLTGACCELIWRLLDSSMDSVPSIDPDLASPCHYSAYNEYSKTDLSNCINELLDPDVRGHICIHTPLSLEDVSFITETLIRYRDSIPFDIVGYFSCYNGLEFHLLQKKVYDMGLLPLPYSDHPISNILKDLDFVKMHYKAQAVYKTDISRAESTSAAFCNSGLFEVAIWFEVWGAELVLEEHCRQFEKLMNGCGLAVSDEAARKLSLGMDAFKIFETSFLSKKHWINVVLPDIMPFCNRQQAALIECTNEDDKE